MGWSPAQVSALLKLFSVKPGHIFIVGENKQLKCNLSDEDLVWPANRAESVVLVSFMALVDGVHARVKAQSFAWNLDPNRVEYFMQAVTHILRTRALHDKRFGNDEENFLRKPQTFHGMARGDYVYNIRLKELGLEKAEVLTQFRRKFIFSNRNHNLSASRPRKLQKFFLWLRNQRAYKAFHYFFLLSLRKFSRISYFCRENEFSGEGLGSDAEKNPKVVEDPISIKLTAI